MRTPEERRLQARRAALIMHARGRTNTAVARQAFANRFYDMVDPDRTLSPEVREKRAAQARKAWYTQLAYKSAASRRKARELRNKARDAQNRAPQDERVDRRAHPVGAVEAELEIEAAYAEAFAEELDKLADMDG